MHSAFDVDSTLAKAYGGAKLSHNGRTSLKAMNNTQHFTGHHGDMAR